MEGKLGDNLEKEKALLALYDFVTTTRYEDIPEEVREEAKRALLDVVGCGIGARKSIYRRRFLLEYSTVAMMTLDDFIIRKDEAL